MDYIIKNKIRYTRYADDMTFSGEFDELEIIRLVRHELKKYGLLKGEPLTAKQLIDGRKGYVHRFNFCPYCGNKIDWKTVLSSCG